MQVIVSVTDFSPLLRGLEPLFRGLKQAGADGVELGLGFKSRWSPGYCLRLSKKYNLSIVSVHQPLWASLGLCFDARAFSVARKLGAQTVTCHPLPGVAYAHPRMQRYLQRLAAVQAETGLRVLLENMPEQYNHPVLRMFFPIKKQPISEWAAAANAAGLQLTLDTDHLQSPLPQQESYFSQLFPHIRNVHLSSFAPHAHHLPLTAGAFKTREFISFLQANHYDGQLTLEICHPGVTLSAYDFEAIRDSIALVRNAWRAML